MRAQLEEEKDIEILLIDRTSSSSQLEEGLKKADFIFHLAGVNRPKEDSEFDTGNRKFTEDILRTLEKYNKQTPLLISSSLQATLDNQYGKSKRGAEQAVFKWAERTGSKVYVYRLPGVFGKWCKPNYNSVVATFCHNIAHNLDITINDPTATLSLVYIDTVVREFIAVMKDDRPITNDGFCHIDEVFQVKLSGLADKLRQFKASRENLLITNFESKFDRYLYATYVSYLSHDDFSYPLEMKKDNRGWLAEFIKAESFGQIFVSRTRPGISRGNHWHHTKIEKFLVLSGKADIKFRMVNSEEIITYPVNGDRLEVVDIPAGYIHSITNTGEEDLLTLFWASEIFNPSLPDTYYQEV